MSRRGTNNPNLNGLPTAILYMGLFGLVGCFALALFLSVLAVFLAIWMRVCDWTGLSATIPSHTGRIWLGVLVYLVIAVPVCVILWKKQDRSQGKKNKGKD